MEIVWRKQDDGIDLRLKPYNCLCALEIFTINGRAAYSDDFGEGEDVAPWDADEYGCGNMQFTPFSEPHDAKILKMYGITEEQFVKIAGELAEVLSFGKCCWCA